MEPQNVYIPQQQMSLQDSKKNNFPIKKVLMGVAIVVIAGCAVFAMWFFMNQRLNDTIAANTKQVSELQKKYNVSTNGRTSTMLSNDQIFQEVSKQFNLQRDKLTYFRIWGQTKVSFNDGAGVNYAYREGIKWVKVDSTGQMGVNECSAYVDVPERDKPICSINSTQTAYMNSKSESVNYPISSAVSYIGK